MSRLPAKNANLPRTSSRISEADSRRLARYGQPSTRTSLPGRASTTVSVAPDGSRVSVSSRLTSTVSGRGRGRPSVAGASKSISGKGLPTARITVTTSKGAVTSAKGKKSLSGKGKDGQESVLKKFDRTVNDELKRRRDPRNVLVATTTSDINLLEAVDNLERAEAAHTFAGTVRAAEEAAGTAESPELAEEAAVAGARDFETELIEVGDEDVPGLKPIQVIGYVGITRPTRATR